MSDHVSRIVWLLVLVCVLASPLRADEKVSPLPVPDAKAKQPAPADQVQAAGKEITNSIGMKLVLIRAGNFMMGSPQSEKEAGDDEKSQHRVRIKKLFYLGKFEVTRGEFRKFVDGTKYKTEAEKDEIGGVGYAGNPQNRFVRKPQYTWRNAGFEQTDSHPVVNVSWNDAVAFCKWLSKQESVMYRLPSEAEWEWACRAGGFDRWNCGDREEELKEFANLADRALDKVTGQVHMQSWNDGFPFTSPVGKFTPNRFGLHDMHGNVGEWCQDLYDEKYYANSPTNDPKGPNGGSNRVHRGGCWFYGSAECRSASRDWNAPSYRNYCLGFRVARDQ